MRVKFGPWVPDLPDLDSGGLEVATNCMPIDGGYGPLNDLGGTVSWSASQTVCGAQGGGSLQYFGTQGPVPKLYKNFADASRTATYNASVAHWSIIRFGDRILAVNGYDTMQTMTTAGSQFLDVSASASAPAGALYLAGVRDFVFAAGMSATPFTVQWCQINNPLRWGASPRLQADSQVLPLEGDAIQAITGGEFLAVLTTDSIWRGVYVGSPLIFRFDQVSPKIGVYSNKGVLGTGMRSVARFENITFFLGQSGFYMFDGQSVTPISDGKVSRFFFDDLATNFPTNLQTMSSAIDPVNRLYIVIYPSTASAGPPDRMLMYHWPSGQWTYAAYDLEFLWEKPQGTAKTLGQIGITAFATNHKANVFTGSDKTATFATGEAQLFPDQRGFVRGIRPLIQNGSNTTTTVEIGKRNRLDETVSYGAAVSVNANGVCPVRADARYHRVRVKITGGFERSMGVDIDAVPSGKR